MPLSAAPGSAAAVLARMAQTPPASTPFVEVSYRHMLDHPMVVSGEMKWLGGDRLERDVEKPYREVAKIDDGELSVQRGSGAVHRTSVSRAPEVGAILAGFRALLSGDAAALSNDFALSIQGGDAGWTLTLIPRTNRLKSRISSIVIDGRGDRPRCMTMHEADGDATVTLLGAMADSSLRSAAPSQSSLAARCRDAQ
jgi:Outer membrane lipoprotein carrier protein LolA-like